MADSKRYLFGRNKWIHIVGTWKRISDKGNISKIYINGELANTLTTSSESLYDPGSNYLPSIGTQNRSTSNTFKGSIDQIKVYNKTLTSTEVTNMYNNQK